MLKWRTRNNAAFTLVELLVVIGIIGVLAGLLLPALASARARARRAKCSSNLHQLSTAMHQYEDDNRYYPGVVRGTDAAANYHPDWQWALALYADPVQQPIDEDTASYGAGDGPNGVPDLQEFSRWNDDDALVVNETFLCPTINSQRRITESNYGYNYQWLGDNRTAGSWTRVNVETIEVPTMTIMLGDSAGGVSSTRSNRTESFWLDPPKKRKDSSSATAVNYGPGNSVWSRASDRHNKRCNFAYLDGHVKDTSLREAGYYYASGENVPSIPASRANASNKYWTGTGKDDAD